MKLSVLSAFLVVAPLMAQFDTAEVLGTVRDNSGSVVSRASIVLTNQGTGIEAKSNASEEGNYTFSNVKIGVYTVTAEAPGFSKAVAKDIAVNVNARQRVDLVLQVGAVSEACAASALLADYHEAVYEQTVKLVSGITDADLDRVVDTSWRPPVTLGVRLVSVVNDDAQHAGQAAFVRGIVLRAG